MKLSAADSVDGQQEDFLPEQFAKQPVQVPPNLW